MKKRTVIVILSIISSIVLLMSIALVIRCCAVPLWSIVNSQRSNPETFLMSSQSPDGKYNLEAYRTEPGATVDFSVKVYIVNDNQKNLIYNAYHEFDAEIIWLDNSTVSINGKSLDLSCGEEYDWRH